MVIRGKGLKLLAEISSGAKITRDEEEARILELGGVLRFEVPGFYTLSYTGEAILNLAKSIESKGIFSIEKLEDNFRFVGSETIAMVDASIKAGGRVSPDFVSLLEERGLAKDGILTDEGNELWEIYTLARPQLVVTKDLANFIKGLPVGPAKVAEVEFSSQSLLLELEAQRLIAFSMPPAALFNFTGLGQKIKEAVDLGYQPFPVAVSVDIMVSIKRAKDNPDELAESERETLQAMGYLNDDLELTAAGEALYMAYKLYTEGALLYTPSIALSEMDVDVILAIDDVISNRNELPTVDIIEEAVSSDKISAELKKILYTLEAFGLVESGAGESGQLVYNLTEWGKRVAEDQKLNKRAISASAVKCITITRKEFSAPNYEWYEEAKSSKLVGNFAPTKSGMLYANLAASVKRLIHISDVETEVLKNISEEKPIYLKEFLDLVSENRRDEVERAINMLDAKGFVEILPTFIVILTDAGIHMKRALSGVPSGFGNPVNPLMIRILEAIREVGTLFEREKKIRVRPDRWKKVEKLSGLDSDTFSEMLILARRAKFVGTNTLTDAGYNLLLSLDLLRKAYSEAEKWFYGGVR